MSDSQGQGMGRGKVRWNRDAITGLISLLVIAIIIFLGVSLTHGNSDYVCAAAVNDSQQGACTDGSWTPWTYVNGIEQRTYTGIQSTVAFSGEVTGVSCSHPSYSASQANGTITTQYAACQVVETGTATGGSGGSGAGNNGGATSTALSSLSNLTETITTGAVSTSSAVAGSYTYYENYMDSLLATSSIEAVPALVQPGETTQIVWTSDHVNACVVTASNGDTWTALVSPLQGETSTPINEQTTYTLTCTTAIGSQLVEQAVVGIVPTFQEQ